MSELTSCNYCIHRRLLARATREGKIVVRAVPPNGLGGINIYMRLPGETLNTNNPDDDEGSHFVAWYMQLPDRCCC